LVKNLVNSQGEGIVRDAYSTFLEYSRDVIGQITFGNSCEAFTVIEAQKAITENNLLSFFRFIMPRLASRLPSLFGMDKLFKGMVELDKLISDPQDGTLLDFLVRGSAEEEEGLKQSEIKSNALAFGMVGIDSTASALTSLVFVLITHPEVQDKVREEIHQIFGSFKIWGGAYEQFKKLRYLTKVIKETLRLYPPFPILVPRITRRPDELGGFHIPAHTSVIVNVAGYNRNPMYWNNPDTFDPERFESKDEHHNHKSLKDIPLTWGGGPRGCIGKRMGMMILRASVVSLLSKYKLISPNIKVDNVRIVRKFGTVKPNPGLSFQVTSL